MLDRAMRRSKNLLNNSCAKEGLEGWDVTLSGGDGFSCDEPPAGCKPITENTGITESLPCWATSFALCMKVQVVDLGDAGFKPALLDSKKPPIKVSDWYAPRLDCGCEYKITVKLLGEDKETELLGEWSFIDNREAGKDWKEAKHTFDNYASGVRYVQFTHGGKDTKYWGGQDTKYWGGHYGVRMTNSGVFVDSTGKNLLDNPNAKKGQKDWTVLADGGDGFLRTELEFEPLWQDEPVNVHCWATSYALCSKRQLVDLADKCIDTDWLDKKRPKITVRDWFTPRTDCGCDYQICVRLLGADRDKEIEKWELVCTRDKGAGWSKAQHTFKRYPAGVRFVEFTHGGKDTSNWSGHYGVQMTKSMVKVGKQKLIKNLVENPSATDGLAGWEVSHSGGDGWKSVEGTPGAESLDDASCWITSFQYCEKEQTVDLTESRFNGYKLRRKTPDITIIDWYGPGEHSGCEYYVMARLLRKDKKTVLDEWEFSDRRDAGADWKEARHVFKNYPKGARYVQFKHGGKDTRYWAGHYGVKVTKSGVYVGKAPQTKKRELGKNLLVNPSANDGINGWEVTSSGGSGFAVENKPGGCKPIKEFNSDAKGKSCWATSHGNCEKRQLIDLTKEGFNPAYLNRVQPEIKISDWFGVRSDAGCIYWLKVRLLNSNKNEIDKREFNEEKSASGDWFQVEDSFTNYGKGVRFVQFVHGGRDNCGWAGRFGAKITCSSVRLVVGDDVSSSSEDE